MTDINKQKFLAELSKLLTFMYEEDRQDAIAMYAMMFDEAEDERKLLQYLVSPTRQAVIIARAYNAKERKLQVSTQSKAEASEASGEVPEFMHAIFQIRDEVMGENEDEPKVSEDQISLFEEPEEQEEPEEDPETQPENEPEQQPEEKPEAEPADEAAQAPKTTEATLPAEPEPEESLPADETPSEAEVQTQDEQSADEQEEKVDAFLENYAPPAELAESEPDSTDDNKAEKPEKPEKPEKELKPDSYYYNHYEDEHPSHGKTELKAKVALLILYIIAAVPLGLAAVILLLAVAITVLAAAALAVSVGILVVSFAFGGFAVFADILVVLGIAFVVLALGLLLLWTFIWMLGGAIPGTIRGIIALGRRWCYKEVRAE